jgi:hypothetical protein
MLYIYICYCTKMIAIYLSSTFYICRNCLSINIKHIFYLLISFASHYYLLFAFLFMHLIISIFIEFSLLYIY